MIYIVFLNTYGDNFRPLNAIAHVPESNNAGMNGTGYSGAVLTELMDTKIQTPYDQLTDAILKDGLNGTDLVRYINPTDTAYGGSHSNPGEKIRPNQTGGTAGTATKNV